MNAVPRSACLSLFILGAATIASGQDTDLAMAEEAAGRIVKSLEWVDVPAGVFEMGCEEKETCEFNEAPAREVTVRPFRLGKYEVTFEQFDLYCDAARVQCPEDEGWGRGDRPVINVSWADAQAFIAWLNEHSGHNFRLPSEAEWEYAARAGSATAYPWGDDMEAGQANCGQGCRDDYANTAPVGQFPPNAFGLHDMHGNVFEWVEDCWHETYDGAPDDGMPWVRDVCLERVHRGGSWILHPRGVRSANRDFGMTRFSHIYRMPAGGFRLAQNSQ